MAKIHLNRKKTMRRFRLAKQRAARRVQLHELGREPEERRGR